MVRHGLSLSWQGSAGIPNSPFGGTFRLLRGLDRTGANSKCFTVPQNPRKSFEANRTRLNWMIILYMVLFLSIYIKLIILGQRPKAKAKVAVRTGLRWQPLLRSMILSRNQLWFKEFLRGLRRSKFGFLMLSVRSLWHVWLIKWYQVHQSRALRCNAVQQARSKPEKGVRLRARDNSNGWDRDKIRSLQGPDFARLRDVNWQVLLNGSNWQVSVGHSMKCIENWHAAFGSRIMTYAISCSSISESWFLRWSGNDRRSC